MARVATGDAGAYRLLVERHLGRAHAIALRVVGNRADAEDAVQGAFTKVWVSAPSWQPGRAAFTTWLYRIIVTTSIDTIRRRRGEIDADAALEELPDEGPGSEAQVAAAQEAERVRAAVAALPARQRVAVTLCYFEEFTNPEAAQIMGVHVKALEGLLVRARKLLRRTLE